MPQHRPIALVVNHDRRAARELAEFLRARGLDSEWACNGESALNAIERLRVEVLVTELRAPRIEGLALLLRALELRPDACAVLLAGPGESAAAADAMRRGAADFQLGALDREKLAVAIERGLAHQRLAAHAADLEARLDRRLGVEILAGASRAMQRVAEQVRRVAASRAPALIEGEPGTGKHLTAEAIHQLSARAREPFVALDCGSLPSAALESELFGVESREFHGAGGPLRGRFELARAGTLYLEEVSALPPELQVRLLRVLGERAFERVGGTETLRTEARIVAGTHRDLAADAAAGHFRADLLERLAVVRIQLPPLRERREDIPLLAERFIRELAREHGRKVTGITRGALERLMGAAWPGNVRGLHETLEAMVVAAAGVGPLDLSDLPAALRGPAAQSEKLELAVGMTVGEVERRLIAATLRATGQDKRRAAAMLGIGLRTLYRKLGPEAGAPGRKRPRGRNGRRAGAGPRPVVAARKRSGSRANDPRRTGR